MKIMKNSKIIILYFISNSTYTNKDINTVNMTSPLIEKVFTRANRMAKITPSQGNFNPENFNFHNVTPINKTKYNEKTFGCVTVPYILCPPATYKWGWKNIW